MAMNPGILLTVEAKAKVRAIIMRRPAKGWGKTKKEANRKHRGERLIKSFNTLGSLPGEN